MLLGTIKLYLVLNFLVLGHFYFFKHTKFEITLRRLVQKKFCEQKNLHFLISKKSMGTDF
jgi:hypothetical protein